MEVYNDDGNTALNKWKEIYALLQIIVIHMCTCLFERILIFFLGIHSHFKNTACSAAVLSDTVCNVFT